MGEYIIGTFNLLLVIIGCQYQKRFYGEFFKRLLKVDISLQRCGAQPSYEATRTYLRRSMAVYVTFFFAVVSVDFMFNKMHADHFVRSSTVYTVPNLVTTFALTQYSAVLHFIRDKLRTINFVLKGMKECQWDRFAGKKKLNVIPMPSYNGYSERGRVLDILRKQHAELSRLVDLLNECFGLLVILILIAAYVILSIQLYAFYKMTEGIEEKDFWLIMYTLLWVILHSFKVLLVLYPINDITDEQKCTGKLLFEINFSDASSSLKTFSDQLLHDTKPPNALRIINLDLTIVGTMVGVLTTYLIILIQFDASSREQAKFVCNTTSTV
jgi:7tm Chemosensory receptor